MSEIFCKHCAARVEKDSNFCTKCGGALTKFENNIITPNENVWKKYLLFIASSVFIVTLFGGAYLKFSEIREHDSDWRAAKVDEDALTFLMFQKKWPDSEHFIEAENEIKRLEELSDWIHAQNQNTLSNYITYNDKCPNSIFKKDVEDKAFDKVVTRKDESSFKDFLASWPKSEHQSEVEDMLRKLESDKAWYLAKLENTKEEYIKFVENFPKSHYVELAKIYISEEPVRFVKTHKYIEMPRPFTFNVDGKERDRLAQIRVTLKVSNENESSVLKQILLIEGVILKAAGNNTVEDMLEVGFKANFNREIMAQINKTIQSENKIEKILFTSYVLQ